MGVESNPEGAERSLAEIARARAAVHPDRTAFVCGDRSLTYAELDRSADAVAARLAALGVGVGDRVGSLGRNHLGYPVVAVAASRRRAVLAAFNWRLSAAELAGVLADAAPRVLFADHEFAGVAAEAITSLEPGTAPLLVDTGLEAAELASWGIATPADPDREPRLDDIAYLVYTSGTTGSPKGVMTSNGALLEHLRCPAPWSLDGATALIVSPVFHAVAVVWTAFVIDAGATGVYLPDPDPATVLAEVERRKVTHTVWVPALLHALLDHPDRAERDLSSLACVIYGASPISEQLLERALEHLPGCGFAQGYGMTETTGPATYLYPDEHVPGSPRLRTAGRAAPNCEVRVVDIDSGEAVAAGVPGEVQVRSAQVASGYLNRPDDTAALFTADGWLRTGDVGTLDADGYLTLTDRVKDVIISGGENVYSGEVERALLAVAGVADACVVGRPSERWGEAVTAVVVRAASAEGAALSEESLIAHCRERLAHFKAPSAVHFVDVLPRNASGKVLRRLVRAPFWEA